MSCISILRLFIVIILLCPFPCVRAQQLASPTRTVILITIDGLRPDMITDPASPAPFLQEFVGQGLFVPRVIGIPPSMTYPSHTTIVTGVTPRLHGIHCNRIFLYNRDEPAQYHLWADSIRATTLWEEVKAAGGITASILWPVTTGARYIDYNVPEYFPTPGVNWKGGAMDYIRPVCSPKGLLEELEREATGRLTDATMRSASFEYDAKVAYMTNYLVNRYRPHLITVHLITTDYAQHATGTSSHWTRQAIASADNAIGLIMENLRYQHLLDSTTVIVTGDHGFADATHRLHPNTLLVNHGLLSAEAGGEWQACFHSLGAAAYLYLNPSLKPRRRKETLQRVRDLFEKQPDSIRCHYRLIDADTLAKLGGDSLAALCIDPIKGTGCSNARTGELLTPQKGGYHGYLNGCDPTCFLLLGSAVRDSVSLSTWLNADSIHQTDIAPIVRHLLQLK